MSRTIDEVIDRMLVIRGTGGELYNHSVKQVMEAKAVLSAMVAEIIGEIDDYYDYVEPFNLTTNKEAFWQRPARELAAGSRNKLREEQRQRAIAKGFTL